MIPYKEEADHAEVAKQVQYLLDAPQTHVPYATKCKIKDWDKPVPAAYQVYVLTRQNLWLSQTAKRLLNALLLATVALEKTTEKDLQVRYEQRRDTLPKGVNAA